MRDSIFHIVLGFFICAATAAWALDDILPRVIGDGTARASVKTVLVVEFGEKAPPGSKLSDAIQQGKRELPLLESLLLPDERGLEGMLELKADGNVGMVVLIEPQDMDLIDELLPLYPDLHFTLIDAPRITYAMNAQNVRFKDGAGMFMLGAIAGIYGGKRITVMAMEDSPHTREMADYFAAGAQHVRPEVEVSTLLSMRPSAAQHTRLAASISDAFRAGTAVLFSLDDEIIEQALRTARLERTVVISGNPPAAGMDTSRLLTYLVKRYDLALLDVLRIYAHNQWHAGTIELGVSGGYVDYSLNADNVEIFPKDSIDRIEILKDYIGQGMYSRTAKPPEKD